MNNSFSKLEKRFSRDSLVAIIRQFEGPGKRGNLNVKKASKSNVCVVVSQNDTDDVKEKYSLGYIRLSKPYIINHFIFSFENSTIAASLNPDFVSSDESQEKALNDFFERVKSSKDYILIEDENLPNTLALFGESDSRWFLGVKNKELVPRAQQYIDKIRNSKSYTINDSKENSTQVKAHQHYKMDIEEDNRIIAKMAFNYLAFEKGFEFILNPKFDLIRNWIYLGGNKNTFVSMIPKDTNWERSLIPSCPNRAHYIIIQQVDTNLMAFVSLYGESYTYVVKLVVLEPNEIVVQDPVGLICDWKNRKEYTLFEHISKLTKVNSDN